MKKIRQKQISNLYDLKKIICTVIHSKKCKCKAKLNGTENKR